MYLVIGNRPGWVVRTPLALQRDGTESLPRGLTWRLEEGRCRWELRTLDYRVETYRGGTAEPTRVTFVGFGVMRGIVRR